MAYDRKYQCLYCATKDTKDKLIRHIGSKHLDEIPEGMTPLQVTFHIVNKHPLQWKKPCRVCGEPCDWDETKGRYNLLCNRKECHEAWAKKMDKDMGDKKGSNRPTATKEGLQKMLAARKISGKYKWSDGKEFTYVGSYEKATLEFMDKVLEIKSEDVMVPGPILEYEFEGKLHFYITDIYYIPYNLIIEVKDGGNNPNTNPEMYENRKKKIAKEKWVIEKTDYNYIRLTNKDFSQLMSVFADLKLSLNEYDGKRVIHINENSLNEGYILDDKDIYYNKEKFEKGDTNLCFVVGLSGSGKTTMTNNMQNDDTEVYQYDDLCMNENFNDAQLKEYGDLFYSFFMGPGKLYRKDPERNGDEYDDKYYNLLIKKFSDYAMTYAKSHKNKKYVLEGIEPLGIVELSKLDNYAVYIKGTSVIKSIIRSSKRDSSDTKGLKRILSFMSIALNKATDKEQYGELEKILKQWRNYFMNKEKTTLNETMAGSLAGALPPMSASDSGVYVINHLKNTAFSPSTNLAVSDTPKFDTIYTIVDGYLRKKDKKYLKECKYSTYFVDNCKESVKEYCESHLDAPAFNDELYHSIFGHDLIFENQITFEDAAIEYEDINIQEQRLSEFVTNYITKGE